MRHNPLWEKIDKHCWREATGDLEHLIIVKLKGFSKEKTMRDFLTQKFEFQIMINGGEKIQNELVI